MSPTAPNLGHSDARIVAVDIGGTSIKSALVNGAGQIQKQRETPTEAQAQTQVVLNNLRRAVEAVLPDQGTAELLGIGIGTPGNVDPKTGRVAWIENIPCLNGQSLTQALGQHFDVPVFIDNDATNAAKGQYFFGAGVGAEFLLGITLGTGVGGGLIFKGQTVRGRGNYAGEIGHLTYIPDGMACTCGKRGCLEAYASATALVRSARSIHKRKIDSALLDLDPGTLSGRVICDLAREGDDVARQLVQEAGKALGVVVGGVINLLNLDRVVIGGGLAAAGDILMEPVRMYASRHALPLAFEDCEIVAGRLGNDAGILGCAATVLLGSKDA